MNSSKSCHPDNPDKRVRRSDEGEAFNDMCETFENRGTRQLSLAIPVGTFAASR